MTSDTSDTYFKNMTIEQQKRWRSITSFQFDPPEAPRPLWKRLWEEMISWDEEFSLRCVEEFRKMAFIATITNISPPPFVDTVWHMLILDTITYEQFCKEAMGRDKLWHHAPSKGLPGERQLYRSLKDNTVEVYAQFFGDPPKDIWG